MDRRTVRVLRGVAAAVVFATAAFHLWWGLPRSIIYAQALGELTASGLPPDPRPFLFVAFAAVLLAGPYLTEPFESGLKTIEAIGIAAFVTLLWKDPAIIPGDRQNAVEDETGAATES